MSVEIFNPFEEGINEEKEITEDTIWDLNELRYQIER